MIAVSIRLRLTAWYAVALLLGLGMFGFSMWWALEQRLIAGVDGRLSQRMHGLETALGAEAEIRNRAQLERELSEFAGEVSDGTLIQLRDAAGAVILPVPGQSVFPPSLAAGSRTVDLAGRPFRTVPGRMRSAGETYDVLLAGPLDDVTATMRDFRGLLVLMVPLVLVVACLGGYWLSSRALRPVDEITSVAQRISVQNLSQRVTVPRTGDELQRMSETWNQVLERLEVAVARIRQFTADASHELRTPLALIRATAELALRRERSPEEYRQSLRTIEFEAGQMTALTENLLTVARADAGGLEMALGPTDLSALVEAVVSQSAAVAGQKGVRIRSANNGHPVVAPGNEAGLRRLLLILIENAVRHTPSGGIVAVAAEEHGDGKWLRVRDTGEGISAEALPHIFERFYRGDPARGSGSGFGLGLSIAQAIAAAHGSQIVVESATGQGACFSMRL